MTRPTSKQSSSLATQAVLRRKLHPHRYPDMSNVLAGIVGYVIGAPFGSPPISHMVVTPEGFLLARPEGEVSHLPVGRYIDLLHSWLSLLNAARLTQRERIEAELLFAAKVGYYGQSQA